MDNKRANDISVAFQKSVQGMSIDDVFCVIALVGISVIRCMEHTHGEKAALEAIASGREIFDTNMQAQEERLPTDRS